MADRLTGISSKATGPLLAELTSTFESETGVCVSIESVGGVDAAKRVSSGEPFDLVILATNAIDQLISSALLLPDSKHELVRSSTAIAVREDSVPPRVNTSDALRETIQSCASVGYSTGPSGQAIVRLFETWGITADSLKPRLVQAEPGIPVGRLLADGKVDIGFQQLSELISLSGIKVLGPMPPGLEIDTVFSAGVCQTSKMKTQAISFLRYLASPQTDAAKRRCGMTPV